MVIIDEQGHEIQDPDLSLGHLKEYRRLAAHHDAIEYQPPVYNEVVVKEYNNGGVLKERKLVTPAVKAQDAWDEYEDVLLYVLYTEEELAAIEEEKKRQEEEAAKVEEAAKAAVRERAAYQALAVMSVSMLDLSAKTNASITVLSPLYPEYVEEGKFYKKGSPFTYKGRYFRASQDITTQKTWHPGDVGTEALFYEFFIADDGVLIWHDVTGGHNVYNYGDRVHYPDAEGPIYVSKVNDNAYSPDVVPDNWTKE